MFSNGGNIPLLKASFFLFCLLKCKKKHILRCPDFTLTGKCANGAKCPLLHKRDPTKSNKGRTKPGKKSTQASETEEVQAQSG